MGGIVRIAATCVVLSFFSMGPIGRASFGSDAPRLELRRTTRLDGIRGPVDRTGIPGRIDHMRYDPATKRLFIACVANGSLEVIDLDKESRAGSITGLHEPQGVGIAGDSVYVTTGEDGLLHHFDTRTLIAGRSVAVGDDADNVRIAGDGKAWVSFGGTGPGGLARINLRSMASEARLTLPKMPEGFQVHDNGKRLFANVPAGKRSTEDGTVYCLDTSNGDPLWQRKLSGHAGNFPMALDSANDRLFVVSRNPARLLCLNARDGSILGETGCPPESDDLFFDPQSGLLAVIGGGSLPVAGEVGGVGASLDYFTIDEAGRPVKQGELPLPPHGRTGTLAVDRRAFYVAIPMAKDRPAELREYLIVD